MARKIIKSKSKKVKITKKRVIDRLVSELVVDFDDNYGFGSGIVHSIQIIKNVFI